VRARDLGIEVGRGRPGALNAITDVAGVRVGFTTLVAGEAVRTALGGHGKGPGGDRPLSA
jgi:D-aminopeptidase